MTENRRGADRPGRGSGALSAAAPELFTVFDLAAALRLRPATVRRMAAQGQIGYHRLNGKELRFTRADFDGLLERTRVEAQKSA